MDSKWAVQTEYLKRKQGRTKAARKFDCARRDRRKRKENKRDGK